MASPRLVTLTLAFTLLLTSFAEAAPAKKSSAKKTKAPAPEVSLREQAVTESKNLGPQKNQASEVQMESGVLALRDPRPMVTTRQWNYFVGVSAQQFQPQGTVASELNSFDLGKNGQTLMPAVEVGILSKDLRTQAILWNLGVQFKGAFSSQTVEATYQSGAVIDDTRLNSTLLSVGPSVAVRWEGYAWLSLIFTPEFGSLTYTQTSSSQYGKFSKGAGYQALTTGLDFRVGEKWSLFTNYSQRELTGQNQLALQKDNFELGTKVTW